MRIRPSTAPQGSLVYATVLHSQRLAARVVERITARPALGEGSVRLLDPFARRAGWIILARWSRERGYDRDARAQLAMAQQESYSREAR